MNDRFTIEDMHTAYNTISNLIRPSPIDYSMVNPCAEMPLTNVRRIIDDGYFSEIISSPVRPDYPSDMDKWYNLWILGGTTKVSTYVQIKGGNTMYCLKDEIIITKSEYPKLIGVVGVVREIVVEKQLGRQAYGIEFESNIYGHDLGGKVEFGKGWYVLEDELEMLNKSKLCRMIVKDESLIGAIKFNSIEEYQIRKNGALTFLTTIEGRKVFVYKDGSTKPLIKDIQSDMDKKVTLHLMEVNRIMPFATLNEDNVFVIFSQEESDARELLVFPATPTPVAIKSEEVPTPKEPFSKSYDDEDAFYAEMGITKK